MISLELLRWVVRAEAVALVLALVAVVGHVAWRAWADPRRERRLAAARERLAAALAAGAAPTDVATALTGLPQAHALELLAEYAPVLAGAERASLARVGADAGLVAAGARQARARRWPTRLQGARVLTVVGGGDDVMPDLLDDRRPEVRAQASAWAVDHATPDVVRRLVRHASAADPGNRFAVQDALVRLGPAAVGPLVPALDAASGAAAERLLEVCVPLADRAFAPAALRLLDDPLPATRARAATLAARTAIDDAADELVALLDDPEPVVRAAACRALGEAQHWPAGARLRAALADPVWTVRHAAGEALERLGPAGTLLLRRTLDDGAPAARDMARRMLALPAGGRA
ncbi:HEAT repeat domain-containing protein [Patulibacter sp. SYSU D01012]|uniref:HEAT repeat domain-containing protein n=1 Tax=Patulibacter sp. SYSU D01012 TaxID=2817381 RepID=UPI001B304D13|nr:HEAT repeat domain-containing protein [Patulibacter sp. SYSU D01012]